MLILFPSMVYFWFVHCLCNYSYFFSEYETLGNRANFSREPQASLGAHGPYKSVYYRLFPKNSSSQICVHFSHVDEGGLLTSPLSWCIQSKISIKKHSAARKIICSPVSSSLLFERIIRITRGIARIEIWQEKKTGRHSFCTIWWLYINSLQTFQMSFKTTVSRCFAHQNRISVS